MNKSAEAFRTISEVSEELDVPKHVLRFWEARFPQIKPMKRGGGRRYYRPEDVELLKGIRHLLHAEGYTIRGVQKILRQQGVDEVKSSAARADAAAASGTSRPASDKGAALPLEDARIRPRSKPAKGRGGPAESTRVLLAAIAELEALRAMLRGEAAALPAGRGSAAPAKRTRSAR